jgi:hypothetical protein
MARRVRVLVVEHSLGSHVQYAKFWERRFLLAFVDIERERRASNGNSSAPIARGAPKRKSHTMWWPAPLTGDTARTALSMICRGETVSTVATAIGIPRAAVRSVWRSAQGRAHRPTGLPLLLREA